MTQRPPYQGHVPPRPIPPPRDFILPAERVPREPSAAVPLQSLLIGVGVFCLFLYALPDLAAWISTWGICR